MRLKNDSIVAGRCNGSNNIGRMWGNAVNRECEWNGASENTGVASKEEEKTDGQITLQVVDWSDGSAAQREEFHKKFEETHPNIKIEYTMLTVDQFKNTIVTMIKSGKVLTYFLFR